MGGNAKTGSLEHTPLKIDMEPKNHPFEKEKHLRNLPFLGFQVDFPWCKLGTTRVFGLKQNWPRFISGKCLI